MNYSEKLRDPRWQRKRLEIFSRDDFKCSICKSVHQTLHAHHLEYHKEPWDAPNDKIVTLCEGCHDRVEDLKRRIYCKLANHFHLFNNFYNLIDGLEMDLDALSRLNFIIAHAGPVGIGVIHSVYEFSQQAFTQGLRAGETILREEQAKNNPTV